MKFLAAFLLAASAVQAIVIPNQDMNAELLRETKTPFVPAADPWLDALGSELSVLAGTVENSVSSLRKILRDGVRKQDVPSFKDFFRPILSNTLGTNPHESPEKTIWQLISESEHTKTFASLVSDFPDVIDKLNSTSESYTVFVPTDDAFKRIHHREKKPPKEAIERFLLYLICNEAWSPFQLAGAWTLQTLLHESMLDDYQRLRTSADFHGLQVNLYSRVIGSAVAKNGFVHGLNRVVIPPLSVGQKLSLLPSVFSTLLHAYEKTNFVSYVHGLPMEGSTVLAPTNGAWARLGLKANAFLFETEKGHEILKAILKYHIVPNITRYSNAEYDHTKELARATFLGHKNVHDTLDTLLPSTRVTLDIDSWGPVVGIRVDGHIPVIVRDFVARNGVIHVTDGVPLPPCKDKEKKGEEQAVVYGEISVEELVKRMTPYVGEGKDREFRIMDL